METTLCQRDGTPVTPRRKPGPKGPSHWTPEAIEQMAQSLLSYFEEPDSLFLETWCAQEGIPLEYISRFAATNDTFADALALVSARQASRLLEGGIHNRLNSKIAALVLASRFGFSAKTDVTLRRDEQSDDEKIHRQAETLVQLLPKDPTEARLRLDEFRQSGDQIIQAAADRAEQLLLMTQEAESVDCGVVDG